MKIMLQRIAHLLVAAVVGCGLLLTATSCNSKGSQLKAAVAAINKQFPQQVADGAVLEGFVADEANIDIAVTLQEGVIATEFDTARLKQMKDDLVLSFTLASRQDKSLHDLFQLISDNGKTLSLTVTAIPSQKKQRVTISGAELEGIINSAAMSAEEMGRVQLDQFIASQQDLLPMQQGPVTCTAISHRGDSVVWEYEADESVIDIEVMQGRLAQLRHDIVKSLAEPDGMGVVRTMLDANCSLTYRYIGATSRKSFDLTLTTDELRSIQKETVSTKIAK